jgi:hypothetical protein
LRDDVLQAIFAAMPNTAPGSVVAHLHAILRTLRWEHGANYYVLRSPASVKAFEELRQAVTLAAENLAPSWDGEDYPDHYVSDVVTSVIVTLERLFPAARDLWATRRV